MWLMWCLPTNKTASPFGHPGLCHLQVRFGIISYREKFALLQREAERNVTWLIASLRHLVPSGDESPPCLVEVVLMDD